MDRSARDLDFLKEAEAQRKPPYHPYRPLDGGRIEGVYGVVALALPRGTTAEGVDLVYPATAQGFSEFSTDSNYGIMARYMLQSFVLGCNMPDKGTPWLSLPKDHPKESEAVAALCRKILHAPGKNDKEKFYHMYKSHSLVDVELAKILKTSLDKGYAPSAGSGEQGEEEPSGESLGSQDSEDGDDEDEDQRMGELEALFEEEEAEEEQVEDHEEDEEEDDGEAQPMEGVQEDAQGADHAADQEEDSSSSSSSSEEIGFAEAVPAPRPRGARAGGWRAQNEQRAVAERAAEELLDGVLKERIKEKVHVIYQDFTDDAGKSVGGIMWFFQLDPLFNMGEVICEIIKHKKERDDAIVENYAGSKRRGYNVFREKWPHLAKDGEHVIHKLNDLTYMNIVAQYTGDAALMTDQSNIEMAAVWEFDKKGTPESPNPYYPTHAFTPYRALQIMQKAGARESQCSIANYRPQAQWDDQVPINGQQWCVPSDMSYWFHHKTVFWHNYGKVGLSGLCFPNITLQKRVNADAMALVPTNFDLQIMPTMGQSLSSQTGGLLQLVQVVPWDPNAKVKKDHMHQLTAENKSFRKDLPTNPEVRGERFSEYCRALSKFKQGAIAKAAQVLKFGNPYISAPMQNILKWEKEENIRKVSTYLPHSMPQMDTTANMIIRDALYAKHYRHVASEIRWWLLCHYGLMDCYHYDHEVHLNVIFHGMSQTGKSFFLFDATEKSWIPGTILDILEESNRASNTDEAVVDWCIVKDEVEDIIVDGQKAEKDKSGRAEREKSKLTNCRLTYKVLVLRQNERGGTDRVAEYIETDFVTSCGCATNKQVKVKGDEALASRFAKFTICRPAHTDVFEFLGIGNKISSTARKHKDEMKLHLRVVQGIIAKVQKLIQGEVIGQPSMDVFNVMIARMLAYLKEQGFDVSEQRQIQLMERYAYQLTIRKAVFDLYMKPGAPLFGKPFNLQDMIAHGDWLDDEKAQAAMDVYNDAMNMLQAAQTEYDKDKAELESIEKTLAMNPGKVAEAETERLENQKIEMFYEMRCLKEERAQAISTLKKLQKKVADLEEDGNASESDIRFAKKEVKRASKALASIKDKRAEFSSNFKELKGYVKKLRESERAFIEDVKMRKHTGRSSYMDVDDREIGAYEALEMNTRAKLEARGNQIKSELQRREQRIASHYQTLSTAFSHMEGSPGIEPFMVCTKQITIFVWTKMGEMLIDPVTKIVLEGMAKVASVKRKEGDGVEELFRRDAGHTVPWETIEEVGDMVSQTGDGEEVTRVSKTSKFNLNYFQIQCSIKDLPALVSENTEPRVSPQDCATYINMMKRKYIRVYTYDHVDAKTVASLSNSGGTINRQTMELSHSREPRTIPIIRNNYQTNMTYVAVDSFERYNVELLMEAVTYCLYDGWRDGQVFLFGLPFEKYTEVFMTMETSKSKGPLVPLMKRDERGNGTGFVFMFERQPLVDSQNNIRRYEEAEVVMATVEVEDKGVVTRKEERVTKTRYLKDEDGKPIYAEVPILESYGRGKFRPKTDSNGKPMIKRCQAFKRYTKVIYPAVDEWGDVITREPTEEEREEGIHAVPIMENGWIVEMPIFAKKDAGLIDKHSMGPCFYVPEAAYIDDVASDLLCMVAGNPNTKQEDMVLDPDFCDRKGAVMEIEDDLDDWGLEIHCLREGIDSRVIKTIASIGHSMEFVAAHVRWDPVFAPRYNSVSEFSMLGDYPHNLVRAIEKRRRAQAQARNFEDTKKKARLDAELRRQAVNVSDSDWRSFINKSKSQPQASSLSSFFPSHSNVKRSRKKKAPPAPRAESPILNTEQAHRARKRKKRKQITLSAEQTRYMAMGDDEVTRMDYSQSPKQPQFIQVSSANFDSILGGDF